MPPTGYEPVIPAIKIVCRPTP